MTITFINAMSWLEHICLGKVYNSLLSCANLLLFLFRHVNLKLREITIKICEVDLSSDTITEFNASKTSNLK
jgi:hypothetical protein